MRLPKLRPAISTSQSFASAKHLLEKYKAEILYPAEPGFDEGERAWLPAYAEEADYDLESVKYYEIYSSVEDTNIIGYIVEERSTNAEMGLRILVTAKFDADGNQIGEAMEESHGLDE